MTGSATYDRANGDVSVILDYAEFASNDICMSALTPASFGYVAAYDDNEFTVSLRVDSFVIAMAVNLGIMGIDDLIIAQYLYKYIPLTIDGKTFIYVMNEYFDIRFNTMAPILCISNVTALPSFVKIQQLCFVDISGRTLVLPVFNHYGDTNSLVPDYCDCKTNGHSEQCNQFVLLSSYVVFNTSTLEGNIKYLVTAVSKWGNYDKFNRAAYNATFAAAAMANNRFDPILNTSSWRRNAFQFCNISGYGGLKSVPLCSVVVFNSFDFTSQQVSDYHFALRNGSCSNSFTIDEDLW